MRRLAGILIAAVVVGWGASALASSGSTGVSSGRFDVIFDDAQGLVAGQLVKIAGARAGSITAVHLTPGFKARIAATVEAKFMPFHQDATCTIRPEGLIAENYLQCDPGTTGSPALRSVDGYPPTVPVTHTTEPVSLLDLFNTFNLPTTDRLSVLLNELGIATAGEGQNINQILLRANPTLTLARRTIDVLLGQQSQLKALIDSTATIAAQAAAHTGSLQSFLERAASLTTLTADHRSALAEGIKRLPGLLTEARPALRQLDTVAEQGTPLLGQLQAAAPVLGQVSQDLKPFEAAAAPGLARMAAALRTAIPSLHDSLPLLSQLESYARRSEPSTELTAKLYENLQQHGFVEEFLAVTYYVATSLSRYDSTSHLLPLLLLAPHNGECGKYATKPVKVCSGHYGSQPAYRPENGPELRALTDYLLK